MFVIRIVYTFGVTQTFGSFICKTGEFVLIYVLKLLQEAKESLFLSVFIFTFCNETQMKCFALLDTKYFSAFKTLFLSMFHNG